MVKMSRIQPMGLRGCRRATMTPTPVKIKTIAIPDPKWWIDSRGSTRSFSAAVATASTSTKTPSTVAVAGDTSWKRRAGASVATGVRAAFGCTSPTERHATPGTVPRTLRRYRNPQPDPGHHRRLRATVPDHDQHTRLVRQQPQPHRKAPRYGPGRGDGVGDQLPRPGSRRRRPTPSVLVKSRNRSVRIRRWPCRLGHCAWSPGAYWFQVLAASAAMRVVVWSW